MTILHFIWINMKQDFGRGEFAALFSALDNTTYEIYLHTNLKEDQVHWDPYLLKQNPRFTIVPTEFVTVYDGVQLIPQHVSDMYRCKIIYEYGGIYSDMDILWLKDLPVDLSANKLVASWENQSYKVVNLGMFAAHKGNDGFLGVIEAIKLKIKPGMKYLDLFKTVTSFLKSNADHIIPQRWFYLNSFRRLGRAIKANGGVLNANAACLCYDAKIIPIHFTDVVGFHWFASMFPFEDVLRVPAVADTFGNLLNRISQIPKRVL